MADVEANIRVDIDTSSALASIRLLQRQLSQFHTQMLSSGNAANAALSQNMQKNLINSINATGKFAASISSIKSTTESFTESLEGNKLSMREYFRYAGASTKTFGKLFTSEFSTIEKVARERVKTLQTQYIKLGRNASGALQAIKVRPLALDMQNLATKTAIAAQKQAILNQLIKQGTTNLLNWGKNTQWAGRQLMVGFTVPLTMLGVVAGKTFMQIEEQAIRFKKVYGSMFTTDQDVEKAFKDIRALANEFTKYGISVEKTIQMASDAAQSGFMGKALEAQVTQATRLSILGGMEQEKALESTIALQNAFRVSTEDLAESIDFLNAVENQTVLSLDDVAAAIPRVGPIITELGGDIKDLAFFLTAMKEGGVSAEQGANALKSGLGRLINPTKQASEYLAQFGIDLTGIVEANVGDIRGTVLQFARALEPLDDLDRSRAVEKVFGKFQFARILALLNNITSSGSQASRVLKLTASSAQQLAILSERELKAVEESPAYKLQKAMEELKAAMAPVGQEFVKLITPIAKWFAELFKKFNNLDDGVKQFVVGLVATLGIIAPAALMAIGLIGNGVANLIKFFNSLRMYYQGVGSSSSDLAMSTRYLTTEQTNAAAVAASLGQSHAQLSQVFTSEVSAIHQLIAAYQQAAVAAAALNAVAPVARVRPTPTITTNSRGGRRVQMPQTSPLNLASGIISVPGPKGAGDVVPAMLSPGEAVIPASMAKKYAPLINGMIADNIPGYSSGKTASNTIALPENMARQVNSEELLKTAQGVADNLENGVEIVNRALQRMVGDTNVNLTMLRKEMALSAERSGQATQQTLLASGMTGDQISKYRGLKNSKFESLEDQFSKQRGDLGKEEFRRARGAEAAGTRALTRLFVSQGMTEEEASNKASQTSKGTVRAHLEPVTQAEKFGANEESFHSDITLAQTRRANALTAGMTSGQQDGRPGPTTKNYQAFEAGIRDPEAGINEAMQEQILGKMRNDIALTEQELIETGKVASFILEKRNELLGSGKDRLEALERQLTTAAAEGEFYESQTRIPGVGERSAEELARGKQRIDEKIYRGNLDYESFPNPIVGPKSKETELRKEETSATTNDSDPESLGAEDQKKYNEGMKGASKPEDDPFEIALNENKRNSPHQDAFPFGQEDGNAYFDGFQSAAGPGSDPFAVQSGSSSPAFNEGNNPFEENKSSISIPGIPDNQSTGEDFFGVADEFNSSDAKKSIKDRAKDLTSGFGDKFKSTAKKAGSAIYDGLEKRVSGSATFNNLLNQAENAIVDKDGNILNANFLRKKGYEISEDGKNATKKYNVGPNAGKDFEGKSPNSTNEQPAEYLVDDNGDIVVNPSTGTPMTQEDADKLKKDQKKQARGKLAGKVSMGLMGATMVAGTVASMAPEGSLAKKVATEAVPILGTLSAVLPLLMKLPGPLGLIVAGAGLVAYGIYRWVKALDEAREKGIALGNALSMSTDKLISWSKATGTVSFAEQASVSRIELVTGADKESQTYGQEFLQSEAGQGILEDIRLLMKQGINYGDIAKTMGLQFATAVSQGVFTEKQALGIASAIGGEFQDYSFAANIAARVTQIVGPDGKKLEGNKLSVVLEIQKESREILENFDKIMNPDNEFFYGYSNRDGKRTIEKYNVRTGASESTISGDDVEKFEKSNPNTEIVAYGKATTDEMEKRRKSLNVEKPGMFENEKLKAAYSMLQVNQLSMYQQNIDMIKESTKAEIEKLKAEDLQLKKREEAAKKQGKSEQEIKKIADKRAEIEKNIRDLSKQREDALQSLSADRNLALDNLLSTRGGTEESVAAFEKTIKQSVMARYQDDPILKKMASGVLEEMSNLPETVEGDPSTEGNTEFKTTLQLAFAADEIGLTTSLSLMEMVKENPKLQTSITTIMKTRGAAAMETIDQLLTKSGATGAERDFAVTYFAEIETDEEFESKQAALADLSSFEKNFGFNVEINAENLEELDQFKKDTEGLAENEVITKELVAEYIEENSENMDAKSLERLKSVYDNFDALSEGTNRVGFQVVVDYVAGGSSTAAHHAWMIANGLGWAIGTPMEATYKDRAIAETVGSGLPEDDDKKTSPKGDDPGGGGKKEPNWIDETLKKLKNLRDATINAKGGLKELKRVLGGNKVIKIFDGLGQKFSMAGISDAFADELMEMGKKARKKFVTIRKDGQAELTKLGKLREKAYQAVKLGEFNLEQVRIINNTKNQTKAFNILARAGMSVADAYAAVADQALAAAIASGQLTGTALKKFIEDAKKAAAALKRFENIQQIRIAAEEANNMAKAAKQLQNSSYSFAEQQAILSDSALTELFLSGKNKKLLQARIKQILTPEFLQGLFDEGFSNAMDAFAVKEKKIELEFEARLKVDSDIVTDAQNEIAGIEYIIDDLQAELKDIEDQEEKINEAYDKRMEALDEVSEANAEIASLQQGQLSIAEALARGDVAAAAKASQELRAKKAQNAEEKVRKALEESREKELARLVSANGKTRKQLEEEIKRLQDDIFRIEEERLEPATERIRLAEIEKQALIDAITVLGQTRFEWELVENGIDQARIESERYLDTIRQAINLVGQLSSAWASATPGGEEVAIPGSGGGGGGAPRYIEGDDKFNEMIDLYRAMDDNSKKLFRQMVEIGPGEQFINWRTNRANGLISNGNLNRAIAYLKDGKITKAEVDEELGKRFSFAKNRGGQIGNAKFSMGNIVPGMGSSDKVLGLLTPGEYVVRKSAAKAYLPLLEAINGGMFPSINSPKFDISDSSSNLGGIEKISTQNTQMMYNNTYSVNVNVKSDANADDIARSVITKIKQIDSQRIRGNRF
jgi:TP901 family phage tail tape measure protein